MNPVHQNWARPRRSILRSGRGDSPARAGGRLWPVCLRRCCEGGPSETRVSGLLKDFAGTSREPKRRRHPLPKFQDDRPSEQRGRYCACTLAGELLSDGRRPRLSAALECYASAERGKVN
jgi:hypothetical protein